MARTSGGIRFSKEEVKRISRKIFDVRFTQWLDANWESDDSYAFEKSFDTMMKACSHELIQVATGPKPKDKNLKKKYKPSGDRS